MRTGRVVINMMGNNLKIVKKKNYSILNVHNKARLLKIITPENSSVIYNPNTYNIEISLQRTFAFYKLFETHFNNLLFSFNRLWHIKIKFAGKGFKIKRKRKTKSIKFYFYYSHINVIILKNAKLKQRKKNRFIIKTWDKYNLVKAFKQIVSIRSLNIYTKRGIRIAKQVVFRKTGKKSNY